MRRVYPRGTLAAQVLGVVGTEGNGLSGLEYSRNALLHGQTGQRHVVSDAIGQPVSINEAHPEEPGTSVSLTLDANIQQRTEDVLSAVGRVFSPKDATAIVMDPRSGAILAMANWPQVNANDPGGLRRRKRWRTARSASTTNRARRSRRSRSRARCSRAWSSRRAASTSPTRSRSPTARSTTTPNTATSR